MEVLRRIRALSAPPAVAVLTAVPTAANTIEAMRLGAIDHLAKPVGHADLAALLSSLLAAPDAAPPPADPPTPEGEMVRASAALREVQKTIGRLSDSDATVLITGETGTGKEIVARALHRHGRCAHGPFVAVNCAALPAELLESLLFGHVACSRRRIATWACRAGGPLPGGPVLPAGRRAAASAAVAGAAGRHRAAGGARAGAVRRAGRHAQAAVGGCGGHPVVSAGDLSMPTSAAPDAADWLAGDLPTALGRLEAEMIRRALTASRGNRAEAARWLGIHRQLLHTKLARLDL